MKYDSTRFLAAADGTRLFCGITRRRSASASDASAQGLQRRPLDRDVTVVLCDGLACDGFAWTHLAPLLVENFTLVHPHYRDHGRSGASIDLDRRTIEGITRDMLLVIEQLGLHRVVLLSHSMGSQIALEIARAAPRGIVDALVLTCGASGRVLSSFHEGDPIQRLMEPTLRSARSNPAIARAMWGRIPSALAFAVAKRSGEVDASLREADFRRYWEHASMMDGDAFFSYLDSANTHDAASWLGEIQHPTLVIAAERDTFTPLDRSRALVTALPDGKLIVVAGGSHAAPVEFPDEFALHIETFIRTQLGRAVAP